MGEQHKADEFCFLCASDEVLETAVGTALDGEDYGPKIYWQTADSFCPGEVGENGDK